jgi:Flp pilus assembly protein TadG
MAFVLPILLLFIIGTLDLSLAIYAYGTVAEAARCGARYAMVNGSTSTTPVGPTANDSTVASVVKNNARMINTNNLTVTSTWGNATNAVNNPVTVTASYPVPLSVSNLFGITTITVTASTTMTITH